MSVKKFKDINLNKIVFKKKVSTNLNNAKILIYHDDQSLIFQTPIMFSQYGYSIFGDSKYIDLSLVNLIEFEDFLKKIKNLVLKHMRYKHKFYKKDFVDNIKGNKNNLRIRLSVNKETKTFNNNKKEIDIDIKSHSILKCLVSLSCIWINNGKFGIYYNIVQIKHYGNVILNEYEFLDDDQDEFVFKIPNLNIDTDSDKPKIDEKYKKYFKMLELGINREAVKQKLLMDELDPTIIDADPCLDIIQTLPPPPPPPPNLNIKNNIKKCDALFSVIKKGINLKKTVKIKHKPLPKKSGVQVPTLWEVRNTLFNLKKTNIKLV